MLRERTAWLSVAVLGALALVGVGLWLVLTPSASDSGVPDEFTDRRSLLDCGRTPLGPGDTAGRAVTDVGKEVNECFDAALAEGTGAELVVEGASPEGEPVFEYHRALPEGGVEVFIDSRGGGFGPPRWSYFRCPDAQTFVVARGECEYREF
ncbi:hypothetical protein [Blastococcus goldschmidtiae]|uniref:Uncharacterized protein n=1 Tax=Blastococcus goldschmidtiae TaxID=3075546 RepID=A0ABU2KDT7_9ACTN|nr:hypothetical protein [Blastococcus sp. DSM 46792]MDT0278322.1 hypothetical protein [Blastococcus sp. DSM 46792]